MSAAEAASGGVPAFLDDAGGCLSAIAGRPPSRELWGMLSGTAATCMKDEANPQLCALYLKAVAQQLPASDMAMADATAAAANNSNANMEIEMMKAKMLMDILDAVSMAATRCTPRQDITRSGILRALIVHPGAKASFLTQVQVEFCQVALLSGQYRYAARCIKDQWPRPAPTISIRHVLRYFLLRGMIHVGCNDWTMAVRCFWTCLSIPSEIVSALEIAAWKKLVLVQCLQMEDDDYRAAQEYQMQQLQQQQQQQQQQQMMMMQQDPFSFGGSSSSGSFNSSSGSQRGPLTLPKAVPNCISRFLTMAANNNNKQQRAQQQQKQSKQQQPEDVGIMVQEELAGGEMQQQQQQQRQGYSSLGVKVYMDLVYAFVAGDRDKFLAIQTQHMPLLQNDGNLGLVRQCETAMVNRQVYQLSRMFAVIPLTDLAAKLQMDVEPTKALLLQLSLQKTINPSPSQATKWPSIEIEDDGMVVFDFNSAAAAPQDESMNGMLMEDQQSQSELENNIMQLVKLTHDVEKLDVAIATSPMYHALVRRAQDAKMGGPRGVEEL